VGHNQCSGPRRPEGCIQSGAQRRSGLQASFHEERTQCAAPAHTRCMISRREHTRCGSHLVLAHDCLELRLCLGTVISVEALVAQS
jgi:hypothetical protein